MASGGRASPGAGRFRLRLVTSRGPPYPSRHASVLQTASPCYLAKSSQGPIRVVRTSTISYKSHYSGALSPSHAWHA